MRKLYLLLVMLCMSVGTWATVTGPSNGVVYVENLAAGDFAKLFTEGTAQEQAILNDASATRIYFSNTVLNAEDLAAFSNLPTNFKQADLAKATLAEGTELSSITSSSLEYIDLPLGEYDNELSALSVNCTALKAVCGVNSPDTNTPASSIYVYSYQAGNVQNLKDTGMFSSNTLSSSETVMNYGGILNKTDFRSMNTFVMAPVVDLSDVTLAEGTTFSDSKANGYIETWGDGLWHGDDGIRSNQFAIFPNTITSSDVSSFTNSYPFYSFGFWNEGNSNILDIVANASTEGLNQVKNLKYRLDENNGLSFAYWNGYQEPFRNNADMMTALAEIPVAAIDFTWCAVSQYLEDFSNLNPATHYITIPMTSNDVTGHPDWDFTNEENSCYTYGDNIWAVSTIKSIENPYAKYAIFEGESFTAKSTTNITYIRESGSGKLAGAASLLSEFQRTADVQIIIGEVSQADLEVMDFIECETMDFRYANISDAGIKTLDNDYVKYLVLPYNSDALQDATANTCAFDLCENLLCVGTYNKETGVLTTHSTKNTDETGRQIPSVYYVTEYLKIGAMHNATLLCTGLEKMVMTGYLCMDDISTNNDEPHGLENASIKSANLENAIFLPNSDMVFTGVGGAGWSSVLEKIILPTDESMTDIPANCLNNATNITTICIPSNYENIGAGAFYNCNQLKSITTTAYTGDDEDIITDHGDGTFTFSSNLKSIGSNAFGGADTYLTDVYVLATTAPKCAAGAFDDSSTYGNNGFDPEHPITRENYNNNGKVIAILHYPNTVTAAEEAKYTDVTRKYSIVDEEHNTDGDGNVLIWPTHAEFGQAYTQATQGVLWDGTTTYDTDYQGWHEFVLSGNHDPENPDPSWNFSNIKDNDWWTLCVPFDMTKAQFTSVFGGGAGDPIVKTMDRVIRNTDTNKITVFFDIDLYAAAASDNDIVIKKHESYLIKPYMDDAKLAQAARVFSDAELKPEGGVWPILRTRLAEQRGAVKETEKYNYTFMGGYIDAPRPAYCYYLGLKDGKASFKWQTKASTKNSWKAYTSIIVVGLDGEKATDSETLNTTSEHNANVQIDKHAEVTINGENYYFSFLNDLDDFATSAGVKEMSLSFVSVDEDGNATAITRVNGEEFDGKVNAVYSISGQNMGNSVNGLAKGMYIINGKKYMVK